MSLERVNIPESVRHRLRNKSREMRVSADTLLQFYAMERFLYRLAQSQYRDRFVLKGALLLLAWRMDHTRPTRDIDLLGFTDNTLENLAGIVAVVCNTVPPNDDGLVFDSETLRTERIKEDADYAGVRATFLAYLGTSRIPMQIDVGFNDVVMPAPQTIEYPVLLTDPAPTLMGYTADSVVAEKFEAMVKLGAVNSRMKDFFDIWLLSQQFSFSADRLSQAILATFERRGTSLHGLPVTLAPAFAGIGEKQIQWTAFLQKNRLTFAPPQFKAVSDHIAEFLMPVVDALAQARLLKATWTPGGPWEKT